jgi:chromosome segregation ATPase
MDLIKAQGNRDEYATKIDNLKQTIKQLEQKIKDNETQF